MLLTDFDLFGHPVASSQAIDPPVRRRAVSQAAKRAKLARHLEQSNNLVLFDELLDFLKAPLLKNTVELDATFASDVGTVAVIEADEDGCSQDADEAIAIPYEAWGTAWVKDANGLAWSKEGLLFTQVRLFWRSMEELALNNNEQDKWSVLRGFSVRRSGSITCTTSGLAKATAWKCMSVTSLFLSITAALRRAWMEMWFEKVSAGTFLWK